VLPRTLTLILHTAIFETVEDGLKAASGPRAAVRSIAPRPSNGFRRRGLVTPMGR
jgi:hypothetical protein